MKIRFITICLIQIIFCVPGLNAQADNTRPEPPALDYITVEPTSGAVEITWLPSPSPDVAGYIIYLYQGGDGFELDTIYDPDARHYVQSPSGSVYYSESYVVAALDSAGNASPLSNPLSTIYASALIDSCNKELEVTWNSYISSPREVLSYSVLCSVNGAPYSEALQVTADRTSGVVENFEVNAPYCIVIKANLSGGISSGSNRACLTTKMQRPPDWINADYATVVEDGAVLLSFTPDPLSEIGTYDLERKTGNNGDFKNIGHFTNISGPILFSDSDADTRQVNYYRLSAINNCSLPIRTSNIASNIVLMVTGDANEINLRWNHYSEWNGIPGSYRLFINTGDEMKERLSVSPDDSVYVIRYSDLMYEITSNQVCFMIKAMESSNPYTNNGESGSSVACIPLVDKIFVPNVFTPDFNSVNDFFRPVLSFTPLSYKLVITDIKRNAVFETTDFNEEWDGTKNGQSLPEGVYLWFLNVRSPSGNNIVRTGTVTIRHNR